MKSKLKIGLNIFMTLFGIFLVSNIIVLGDNAAALEMHEDLYFLASSQMIQGKVLVCFITGILFITGAIGSMRGKNKLLIN